MEIVKSELCAAAAEPWQYPPDDLPEIALAGRSNVGKSSLLNLMTNRKRLAKVSERPGKTRTINFYLIDSRFRIVDLPGYGYSKASRSVSDSWGGMMEAYFENRKGLKKVIQLVDIRHKPSPLDVKMYDYLRYYGLDGLVVCTKADKVSKNETGRDMALIRETLALSERDKVIPVSALKKTGYSILMDEIEKILEGICITSD